MRMDSVRDPGIAVRPVLLEELEAAQGERPALDGGMELVHDVKVRLTVAVGATQMTVGELFALKEGSLLRLDKLTSDPIDLYLDGKLVARGELMASGEHFAMRITEIGGRN
jgi:flagellar motor switch protein FliN/FliY